MRSKAPLALMEQSVMILVFALAAALCVQAFVFSDETSKRIDDRDRAAVEAQNAAELLKRRGLGRDDDALVIIEEVAGELGGTFGDGRAVIRYDADWNTGSFSLTNYTNENGTNENEDNGGAGAPGCVFTLTIERVYNSEPGVRVPPTAVVTVYKGERELFTLQTAWQDGGVMKT